VAPARLPLHYDIKPDNVQVDATGSVVIIDANIAKAIDKCKRGKVVWKRRAAGTPAFMNPLARDGVNDWSPAAEVWSLPWHGARVCTSPTRHSGVISLLCLLLWFTLGVCTRLAIGGYHEQVVEQYAPPGTAHQELRAITAALSGHVASQVPSSEHSCV